MLGRGNAIDAYRNTACSSDLRADFLAGKDAAVTRLGTLAQLQFDHLDLRVGSVVSEAHRVKASLFGSTPEVAAANFPDKVAAILTVVGADPTLASVMRKIAEFGSLVERPDSIGAQGAEAHRRDIEDRGHVGVARVASPDRHSEAIGI